MKLLLKFLLSLLALPFLVPWYLADKAFEYLIQPFIFRKFNLEIERKKIWAIRIAKFIPPALILLFFISRTLSYFARNENAQRGFSFFKYLFVHYANGFIQGVNLLLSPVNRVVYYLQGNYIQDYQDFFISFYLVFLPFIFLANMVYRYFKTTGSINKAVKLRNQAVRDVDIIHFAEQARDNELFLGLDLKKAGRPFFVHRDWLKGHVMVVGSSGTGKTESIVQPVWYQEVRHNVATIVLDGKASRKNIDKFYTIASSLAQARDVYYFNPDDPERSATYNPLLRGSVAEVKQKILASINWTEYSTAARERMDSALNIFLRTMEETGTFFNLRDLLAFFENRDYVRQQSEKIRDPYLKNSLRDLVLNFPGFQSHMAFFIGMLRDLFQLGYGKLLVTSNPTIDIIDIYHHHKDCYFTLPMLSDDTSSMRFLGQLILQDIQLCFHRIALDDEGEEEGLLIIDEMAKFVNPDFIELMQACRKVGVSLFYTVQTLAELENPSLNLTKTFVDQLDEHTNAICCFQIGSRESAQMILDRFGLSGNRAEDGTGGAQRSGAPDLDFLNPNFLRDLDVGRCVLFMRHPNVITVLKTGYFKFEKSIKFGAAKA